MKKNIPIIVIAICLMQGGCLLHKTRLDRLWFYTYSSNTDENDSSKIPPTSFIDLEPDGSYTRDFGTFDHGNWKKEDSLLLLKSISGQLISLPFRYTLGNELQLVFPKGMVLNFEGQRFKFSSTADNPFSIENNRWRIHASKKETEQELKDRLRNHCRYYEIYFRWALDNDLSSIDVRSTPSVIKIYGNGFALKNYEDLPGVWHSYFYDEEDCHKASNIIKTIFEHKDIAWAHTDNKYKMFISAFQQLEDQLK